MEVKRNCRDVAVLRLYKSLRLISPDIYYPQKIRWAICLPYFFLYTDKKLKAIQVLSFQ